MAQQKLTSYFPSSRSAAAEVQRVVGRTEGESIALTIEECEKKDRNLLTGERWSDEAKEMREKSRKTLTVCRRESRRKYHEARSRSRVVVLTSGTGSGKTTQIPQQELWKQCVGNPDGHGKILCLQPRRAATTASAHRVAQELDVRCGDIVGYRIRGEALEGNKTSILFQTEGTFVMEMISNMESITNVTTVIVDEAHERSLFTDLALYLLHVALHKYAHLSVVIMSATIEAEAFAEYYRFARPEVVDLGSQPPFPVQIQWAVAPIPHNLVAKAVFENALDIIKKFREDVLCFVDGQNDVHAICKELERASKNDPSLPRFDVYKLYAALSRKQQLQVIHSNETGSGNPRVIVATNVAETTITLPGVKWVIDSGWHKVARYNPKDHSEALCLEPITQASAR